MTEEVQVEATKIEEPVQDPGPTAREMAKAEEENQARIRAIASLREEQAKPKPEEPNILGLAAQGMDVLHDAIRAHSSQPTHPDYVPPPRTPRQMTALEEELEAGRRVQQRAQEQQDSRPQPVEDRDKEGFTTPAYRPTDLVPDPMLPGTNGSIGGTRRFGA